MNDPKFQENEQVEGQYSPVVGFQSAIIMEVRAQYTYYLRFGDGIVVERKEDQIRLPRPSEEEAWEKATMLIGQRSQAHWGYSNEAWDRETRHQVYKILGSAGIKIEPEVKTDVMRLIGIANAM